MTDEIPFRKPVPVWRTVVNGIWSDILNDWAAAFETSARGTTGLGVFVQDQTTDVLDVHFVQDRGNFTLSADAVIDSRTFSVTAGHGIVVGELIELSNISANTFMQAEVLAVVVNDITIDMPINFAYSTSDIGIRSTRKLLVDGSVTPQIFNIKPLPGQGGDVVRVTLDIKSLTEMDFTTFGGAPALTVGCMMRIKNEDGTFHNLFNFKDNADIIEQAFEHAFLQPKQGNTTKGFASQLTWGGQSNHGVVIRLDGNLNEELQLVIQDDLTVGNTRFHLTAQGHKTQD